MTASFEGLEVGQEIPVYSKVVKREDVKAYADASGDQNPLHQDDNFARSVGFPGIIAHGMFTLGHLASCLVAWAGDPAAVIGLRANFRAQVTERLAHLGHDPERVEYLFRRRLGADAGRAWPGEQVRQKVGAVR